MEPTGIPNNSGEGDSGRIDPVCKTRIVGAGIGLASRHRDRRCRFCCPGCKREFDANLRLCAAVPNLPRAGAFDTGA